MKFLTTLLLSSFVLANAALAANTLYIHHTVKDYPAWRKAFDAHKMKQSESGLTNPRVYMTDGKPNDVSILFDAADIGKAKAFTESEDLKTTMTNAGVVGKPEMHILVTE